MEYERGLPDDLDQDVVFPGAVPAALPNGDCIRNEWDPPYWLPGLCDHLSIPGKSQKCLQLSICSPKAQYGLKRHIEASIRRQSIQLNTQILAQAAFWPLSFLLLGVLLQLHPAASHSTVASAGPKITSCGHFC